MSKLFSTDRFVIINAVDLGITHGTNEAIFDLFHKNLITSTSIMIPCSAAYGAVNLYKQNSSVNIGVHLTLTSAENHDYKPVCKTRNLRSLTTADGFFPYDVSVVELNADPEEVRMELEAQILKAISLGIDLTHIDNHGGCIMGLHDGSDFLEISFDLCEKYQLPFNLPRRIVEQPFFNRSQKERFANRIESADRRGILLIDDMCGVAYHSLANEEYSDIKNELISKIIHLKPGITQVTTHPSIATPELNALTPYYRKREMEYRLFHDPDVQELFESENIKLVSWKYIRDLQRGLQV